MFNPSWRSVINALDAVADTLGATPYYGPTNPPGWDSIVLAQVRILDAVNVLPEYAYPASPEGAIASAIYMASRVFGVTIRPRYVPNLGGYAQAIGELAKGVIGSRNVPNTRDYPPCLRGALCALEAIRLKVIFGRLDQVALFAARSQTEALNLLSPVEINIGSAQSQTEAATFVRNRLTTTFTQTSLALGTNADFTTMNDANDTTGTITNSAYPAETEEIRADIGSVVFVQEVVLAGGTVGGFSVSNYLNDGLSPRYVERSLDGSSWTTVVSSITGVTDSGAGEYKSIQVSANARYIRLRGYQVGTTAFEVYG